MRGVGDLALLFPRPPSNLFSVAFTVISFPTGKLAGNVLKCFLFQHCQTGMYISLLLVPNTPFSHSWLGPFVILFPGLILSA